MWSIVKKLSWGKEDDNLGCLSEDLENLDDLLLKEENLNENLQFSQKEGRVTTLKDDFGLIDEEIYFPSSLKPKICQGPLRKGDFVKYRAQRKDDGQQWKVIELLWASKNDECWMEEAVTTKNHRNYPGDSIHIQPNRIDEENETKENDLFHQQMATEVAKVVNIDQMSIQVSIRTQDREEKLTFSVKEFSLAFALNIGDFLSLKIKLDGATLDDLSNLTIINVQPLRIRSDENAVVTSWWSMQKKGIINNSIYFTPLVCSPYYSPRANDVVEVFALECEPSERNRKCNWRAYKVSSSKQLHKKPVDIQSLLHHPTKESAINALLENKNGIVIDNEHRFGTISPSKEKIMNITVSFDENRKYGHQQILSRVRFSCPDMKNLPVKLCEDYRDKLPIDITDLPDLTIEIISTSSKSYGKTKILCIFEFIERKKQGIAEKSRFDIGTYIHFTVDDQLHDHIYNANLKNGYDPVNLYNANSITNMGYSDLQENDRTVVKGPRNWNKNNGCKVAKTAFLGVGPGAVAPKRLGEYELPCSLKKDAEYSNAEELINMYPLLDEILNINNYPEKWHCLLHVEESSLLHRMRSYEMSGVILRDAGPRLLLLEVPGLAEKRPTLMLGDTAVAELQANMRHDITAPIRPKYEGVIEEVRSQAVLLAFNEDFRRSYAGELLNVVFVLSRTTIKRMHSAVDHCFKQLGPKILFPTEVHLLKPQVKFVTDFGDRDDDGVMNSKNEQTKLNVIKYTVYDEVSYQNSPPPIQNGKIFDESIDNHSDVSDSSSSSRTFESFNTSNSSDKSIPMASSSVRISVAERLFKKAMQSSECSGFITPNVSLTPYSWKNNNNNYTRKNKSNKVGLKYEFCLNETTGNRLRNDIAPKSHSQENYHLKHQNDVAAYIPKCMKRNKVLTNGKVILTWINKNLNPEQKSAVIRILSGEARPIPYIIYGPPGTGKTVTVVEAILQIFMIRSDSRILVTTPSNSSADLIVERLHNSNQIGFGDLARLNAMQRLEDSIPEIVRPFCFSNSDAEVLLKVVRHRIVVATCDTSGGIYKLGLAQGHFSHCFIDEAGETTEPQSMIPIGLLGMGQQNESQIILAGDPKQLGPVLQSKVASNCGLEESYLERLSKISLYERDESRFGDHGNYDPVLCTKLIRNYRSHENILSIPSLLFYDDELKPQAPDQIKNAMLGYEFLPNEACPIIFHGVRGQNIQESDSPSWFNPAEGLQVARYLELILAKGINIEDIGIIAPYRKQTQKLRQLLDSLNLPKPKVS